MTKAEEVIGSLVNYKGSGGCPVCDRPVTISTEDNIYRCTACEWSEPLRVIAYDEFYDKKLISALLPRLTLWSFPKWPVVGEGKPVTFRKHPALSLDAN